MMLRRRRRAKIANHGLDLQASAKKRNILRAEIASCAALLCFLMETLQVVLQSAQSGVRNRTKKILEIAVNIASCTK